LEELQIWIVSPSLDPKRWFLAGTHYEFYEKQKGLASAVQELRLAIRM